jgi:hypothetical protein
MPTLAPSGAPSLSPPTSASSAPSSALPTSATPAPSSFADVYFLVDVTPRSYADSVAFCAGLGYEIASVHSADENDMIVSLVPDDPGVSAFYLGGIETSNGVWKWADGTVWNYEHSSSDGLASNYESQLAITSGGAWNDWGTGSSQLGAVCRRIAYASPVTFAPTPSPTTVTEVFVSSAAECVTTDDDFYCGENHYNTCTDTHNGAGVGDDDAGYFGAGCARFEEDDVWCGYYNVRERVCESSVSTFSDPKVGVRRTMTSPQT